MTTKQRILNVDDSEAGRYATSRILARAGFEVLEAANGTDALKLAAQRPDLILLDVNLPDMSGFEVCKRIKADPSLASIPVVHLSATYVQSDSKVQGLDGGADGYMVQPIDATELVATVRAFLRLQASEAALRQSEARYHTIIQASLDGFWLADFEGRFLEVNEAYCSLVGYAREELLTMSITDIEAAETPAETALHLRKIKVQGYDRFETRHRRKDGQLVDFEISANTFNPTSDPSNERLVVFMRDITERKKAEAEIERQLDELRRWQTVMLGRENRNMEFKREVNALCRRLGEPVRYPSQEGGESPES